MPSATAAATRWPRSYLDSDDEGFVTIRGGEPIEIPDDQRELADELAGTCPEGAIIVIDAVDRCSTSTPT